MVGLLARRMIDTAQADLSQEHAMIKNQTTQGDGLRFLRVLFAATLCLFCAGWLFCQEGQEVSKPTELKETMFTRQLIANIKGKERVLEDAFNEDAREDRVRRRSGWKFIHLLVSTFRL